MADMQPDVLHLQSGYLLGTATLDAARRRGIPSVVLLHDNWFVCPRVILKHADGRLCSGPEQPAKCAWCLSADHRILRRADQATGWRLGAIATGRLAGHVLRRIGAWRRLLSRIDQRQQRTADGLRHADAVLAVEVAVQDRVSVICRGTATIGLHLAGVPTSPTVARMPRPSGQKLRVGFLGQIAPHKGVHVLAEALQGLGNLCELRMHGDHTISLEYVRRLSRLLATVPHEFNGKYDVAALPTILAGLDVVVVPSTWPELRPLVILESQAAGVPVIASAIGGIPGLVRHEEDGVLVPPGDVVALRNALLRVATEPGLLAALRNSAPLVRTVDDEMAALLATYSRVIGQRITA
jgi:glycosyltransferase involved in cell wall biosynthesis